MRAHRCGLVVALGAFVALAGCGASPASGGHPRRRRWRCCDGSGGAAGGARSCPVRAAAQGPALPFRRGGWAAWAAAAWARPAAQQAPEPRQAGQRAALARPVAPGAASARRRAVGRRGGRQGWGVWKGRVGCGRRRWWGTGRRLQAPCDGQLSEGRPAVPERDLRRRQRLSRDRLGVDTRQRRLRPRLRLDHRRCAPVVLSGEADAEAVRDRPGGHRLRRSGQLLEIPADASPERDRSEPADTFDVMPGRDAAAWLDEPLVTQAHRVDDTDPAGTAPFPMPPFN